MRHVINALAAVILVSCTHEYVPQPTSEGVFDSALQTGQPVAIINKTAPRVALLPVSPYDVRVDYRQYADLAIQLFRGELEKQGRIVETSASREIGLDVTDVRIVPGMGRFRAVINCTVTTGDGYVVGLEASGASWNFERAIDGAIVDVVNKVLTHYRIRQYLHE